MSESVSTAVKIAPLVIIVSGPSGSGKSTLVQRVLEMPGTMPSISCTTRGRRATESSGKCYDFVTDAEFEAMVGRGEFLEYRARVWQALVRHAEEMAGGIAKVRTRSGTRDRCAGGFAGEAAVAGVGGDFYFAAFAAGIGKAAAVARARIRTRISRGGCKKRARKSQSLENITIFAS